MNVSDVVTVAAYCELHGLDYKRVRRMLRKNELPGFGAFRIGDARSWFVHADESVPTLPAPKLRGASRDDGRQRYDVWVAPPDNDDQRARGMDQLARIVAIVGNDNVRDPRIAARNRRLARKAAAAETAGGE